MNILFFSHYFPPEGNAPASRTYENCKRWVQWGHQVTVVTCVPNCPEGVVYQGYKNRFYQRELQDGIEVIRVWTYIAANKGTIRRILNYVSYMVSAVWFCLLRKKPDLLIATSPQFFCGWAGVILSKLRSIPFILEIRDIWPESITAVEAMKNQRLLQMLEWLEHKMYAAAGHIVTVGDGYRQRLMQKGVPDNKISIVMNGVDMTLFFPRTPDLDLKQKLGIVGKFICSYIGTIGMACGLDITLRAAKILQDSGRYDIVFLLVGDGAVRQNLQDQVKKEGITQVILPGRQPKELMPNFFSITDVSLIHLKKTELFTTVMPSKIFETAGMAVPIIIGVAGEAMELIEKAKAGIAIEPENEKSLVDAVCWMADNLDKRREMGKSGYQYITTYYDREKLAKYYLTLLENFIHPPKVPVS